jgi:hypothetical protein
MRYDVDRMYPVKRDWVRVAWLVAAFMILIGIGVMVSGCAVTGVPPHARGTVVTTSEMRTFPARVVVLRPHSDDVSISYPAGSAHHAPVLAGGSHWDN